ncbi:MAG: choice-of-anchor Q domain-containing protein [Bacteroidia bacterium]|nr:choice-of-anchor Q domain-containing protein [Bacteroidia bacterium]
MSKYIPAGFYLIPFIFFFSFLPTQLWATSFPVSSNADSGGGSLREAVSIAQSGDTINFSIVGEIVLDSQLFITKNLWILGPGADQLAITTQDSTRLFNIGKADTVSIEGLRFYNGNATGYDPPYGGAISNSGVLRVKNCLFHENIATSGGAIDNAAFGLQGVKLYVENCSFYRNLAIQPIPGFIEFGGAIYADARGSGETRVEISNSTFAENKAKISGGAIYLVNDAGGQASILIENSTIAFNEVEGRCGGLDISQAGAAELKNSLLADNIGRIDIPNIFGALRSQGNNLIDDTTNSLVLVSSPGTDLFNVDAELGPFGLNGGIFPTVSLRCTSPAIDAGDDTAAPLTDSRGQTRISTSDIGSFERNASLDLQISNLQDNGYGSLRQALDLACTGDTLRLGNVNGVIRLASTLEISQNQVIYGNPQNPVFLNGGDSLRILYINPGIEVQLKDLNFEKGNPSSFGGGAIMNKGKLRVENSAFRWNKASGAGAIANYGDLGPAEMDIINCSFAENEAEFLDGGAIDNRAFDNGATANILHCSFALNRAGNRGGALYNASGADFMLTNSIVSNNQAVEGDDVFGDFFNEGINIVQNEDSANWLNLINSVTILAVDPLLDPFEYYGGSSYSFRLQSGSPAIDAGDNSFAPQTDQRGQVRIFNGSVDLGAYEYDPATGIPHDISASLLLFPQPNKGYFTLSWKEGANQEFLYELRDLQGRIISLKRLKLDAKGEVFVDESSLSPAYYVLRLRSKDATAAIPLQILR